MTKLINCIYKIVAERERKDRGEGRNFKSLLPFSLGYNCQHCSGLITSCPNYKVPELTEERKISEDMEALRKEAESKENWSCYGMP